VGDSGKRGRQALLRHRRRTLNPVIDALRRNGQIEFIHVRHEEYGVFAAVADAYLTGNPVAVCGTAGPGVTNLFNGLMDVRKEGASIIAIAGDVHTRLIDTSALEELYPYKFFDTAYLYVGRVVNPEQARAVFMTAILTAVGGARAQEWSGRGGCSSRPLRSLAAVAYSLPHGYGLHPQPRQTSTERGDSVIRTIGRNVGLV
jgi:hypothetical protein